MIEPNTKYRLHDLYVGTKCYYLRPLQIDDELIYRFVVVAMAKISLRHLRKKNYRENVLYESYRQLYTSCDLTVTIRWWLNRRLFINISEQYRSIRQIIIRLHSYNVDHSEYIDLDSLISVHICNRDRYYEWRRNFSYTKHSLNKINWDRYVHIAAGKSRYFKNMRRKKWDSDISASETRAR